jgi:hypothetical protein
VASRVSIESRPWFLSKDTLVAIGGLVMSLSIARCLKMFGPRMAQMFDQFFENCFLICKFSKNGNQYITRELSSSSFQRYLGCHWRLSWLVTTSSPSISAKCLMSWAETSWMASNWPRPSLIATEVSLDSAYQGLSSDILVAILGVYARQIIPMLSQTVILEMLD